MLSARSCVLVALLAVVCLSAAALSVDARTPPTPNSVLISGYNMTVNGQPFKVKGVAYSPVPIGENVHFPPYGDYFTADYVYLWARDFPAIKAMGMNTLRIYAWARDVDHTAFLDAAHAAGLYVIMTHYVGTARENPINNATARQGVIDTFVRQVAMIGDHPALLAWSFGNEINGAWNGFIPSFEAEFNCGYTVGLVQTGACSENVNVSNTVCHQAQLCMYTHLFGWLDSALEQAKAVSTRPMTSTFADVGMLVGTTPLADKLSRFEYLLPHFDMVSIQLYRGQSFQTYFDLYAAETSKPLLVAEYGVDAMNDPCGWYENDGWQPCYNYNTGAPGTKGGSKDTGSAFQGCVAWGNGAHPEWTRCAVPGEVSQDTWNMGLTMEIQAARPTLGGVMMEWHDEYWKNIDTQDKCVHPALTNDLPDCTTPGTACYASFAMNNPATQCTYKAHISCSNYNTSHHDLCGYWLWSAPDNYVNEAWFGMMGVVDCVGKKNWNDESHHLSVLEPRRIVSSLSTYYGGSGSIPATSTSCDALTPCWQCAQSWGAQGVMNGVCNTECGMNFVAEPSSTAGAAGGEPSSSTAAAAGGDSSSGANSQSSSGAAVGESSSGMAAASSTSTPAVTAVTSSSSAAAVAPSSSSSASVVVVSSSSSSGSAARLSSSTAASASAGATGSSGATGTAAAVTTSTAATAPTGGQAAGGSSTGMIGAAASLTAPLATLLLLAAAALLSMQ